MKKARFQINGMHCNSCAMLIEEKLKGISGIIKAKTSFDQKKLVAVYDEQKIKESEIEKVVQELGDYKLLKIENEEEEGSKSMGIKTGGPRQSEDKISSEKVLSSLNLLTSLVIISLALNVVLVLIAFSGNKGQKASAAIGEAVNNNLNNGNQVKNSGQSIQSFQISATDHVRGDFNAPVTLVEFSDFECPYCGRHFPTLVKILSDYAGKVRLVYKHFPLPFHKNSQKAAEASECASEQGRFWEYHDKLFENQASGFSIDKFKQWAKDLNLNSSQFNNCLDSGKYSQKVQADLNEGQQRGVTGTPATFINGNLISGAQSYDVFKKEIDKLLVSS